MIGRVEAAQAAAHKRWRGLGWAMPGRRRRARTEGRCGQQDDFMQLQAGAANSSAVGGDYGINTATVEATLIE